MRGTPGLPVPLSDPAWGWPEAWPDQGQTGPDRAPHPSCSGPPLQRQTGFLPRRPGTCPGRSGAGHVGARPRAPRDIEALVGPRAGWHGAACWDGRAPVTGDGWDAGEPTLRSRDEAGDWGVTSQDGCIAHTNVLPPPPAPGWGPSSPGGSLERRPLGLLLRKQAFPKAPWGPGQSREGHKRRSFGASELRRHKCRRQGELTGWRAEKRASLTPHP